MLPTPTWAEVMKESEDRLAKLTALTEGVYFLRDAGVIAPEDMEFLNAYTQSALQQCEPHEEKRKSRRRILENFLQRFSGKLPEKAQEEIRKVLDENLAPPWDTRDGLLPPNTL